MAYLIKFFESFKAFQITTLHLLTLLSNNFNFEPFVWDVLRYGRSKDVLSCLVFFDWAGRRHGFHHTRSTFNFIFKILSKAKLMTFMLDFLGNYKQQRYIHHVRFYDTLIMGYAIVGRPDFAFEMFGKMCFQGLDFDSFAYHVLFNALVEENCFDKIEIISKHITRRGYVSHITHSILLKNLCKKNKLDEAEAFLDGLINRGQPLNGHNMSEVVEALCKNGNFEQAAKLIEKFGGIELFPMKRAYGVWRTNLARTGKLNMAMDFLHDRKSNVLKCAYISTLMGVDKKMSKKTMKRGQFINFDKSKTSTFDNFNQFSNGRHVSVLQSNLH